MIIWVMETTTNSKMFQILIQSYSLQEAADLVIWNKMILKMISIVAKSLIVVKVSISLLVIRNLLDNLFKDLKNSQIK